jgi:hypothetical protein
MMPAMSVSTNSTLRLMLNRDGMPQGWPDDRALATVFPRAAPARPDDAGAPPWSIGQHHRLVSWPPPVRLWSE